MWTYVFVVGVFLRHGADDGGGGAAAASKGCGVGTEATSKAGSKENEKDKQRKRGCRGLHVLRPAASQGRLVQGRKVAGWWYKLELVMGEGKVGSGGCAAVAIS